MSLTITARDTRDVANAALVTILADLYKRIETEVKTAAATGAKTVDIKLSEIEYNAIDTDKIEETGFETDLNELEDEDTGETTGFELTVSWGE